MLYFYSAVMMLKGIFYSDLSLAESSIFEVPYSWIETRSSRPGLTMSGAKTVQYPPHLRQTHSIVATGQEGRRHFLLALG